MNDDGVTCVGQDQVHKILYVWAENATSLHRLTRELWYEDWLGNSGCIEEEQEKQTACPDGILIISRWQEMNPATA